MSVALALMTLSADALFSQESQPARRTVVIDGREAVEGEVIVRYRSQAGRIQRARAEIQADSDVVEPIGRLGARRLRSYDLSTSEMIARLSANPDVEFVEPNYIIRATAVPNDPSFGSLWGLFNTGQTVDGQAGTPGADIGATAAWDLNTGSRANIVAILDTGIDFFHPDLAANVFAAPRRFSVTLGSTTVTCETGTHGFNALNNSCLPFDDGGHGTHVAGIIGAVGNNNIGVTGVNWTTTLMAIKVLAADGTGTTTDAIKGIDFAIKAKAALGADANIRVINASWGGGDYSQALRNEIEAANGADMLFVAAAGSGGNNTDAVPHYPASLPGDNILSVAAVNNRGTLASFSNYGAASVDLAAPGGPTLSTLPSNKYGSLSGTSMAVPHVSGAAALVLAHCPSPTATLKSILMSSVDPEASLSGKTVSGGRLNVGRALQTCQPELHASISGTTVTATLTNGSGNPKDWLGFFCPASSADGSYIDWRYLNGTRTAPASGMSSATVTFTAPSANGTTCNVRLFSNNELIKVATSETVTVAPQRTLAIDDISVTEGNSGTSTATFTVTLSPANPSQTVAVNYATANGTASSGSDYVAKSGSVTFEPGSTTRTIDVSIIGDTTYEPSETFTVNLSSAVNASIADAQGLGTIVNDDTAPQPTITAPSTATSGSTLSVSIANGPGNATDWVGLFPSGGSDTSYITWMYLNGSRTPPSSGMTSATVSFPAPAAGTYNVRMFENNGSTKIATSNTITVSSASAQSPTITVPSSVAGGATFSATVANGPGNAKDWIGIFTSSGNDSSAIHWMYLNGSRTAPSTGMTQATVQFTAPTAAGTYNVRLFADNSSTKIATSADITVSGSSSSPPPPPPSGPTITAPSTATSGSTLSVSIANGPGNTTDWVGLFPSGGSDTSYITWMYLNGSRTPPSSGMTSATVSFPAPAAGTYNVRLFENNGSTKIATSNTITVSSTSTQSPSITVPSSVAGGATFSATVANGPGNAKDWIGIFPSSGNDSSYIHWMYLNGSRTAPSTGMTQATVQFTAPTSGGPYNVRLFADNGSTKIATSADITVSGSSSSSPPPPPSSGPTITAPSSATTGSTMSVSIANGPGNTTDWVGLFPSGGSDTSYITWMYLNGSRTPPSSGMTSATVSFSAPAAGTYNVRMFANNGSTKIATSNTITVSSVSPSITVPSSVAGGATFTATIANGPGYATDWVGIFPSDGNDNSYIHWMYLNGTRTAPATGTSNASVQFTAPTKPGTYNVRLFANNGPEKVATSTTITVP